MIGLGALVVEHFAALEADFQRFYGLELPALLWGPEPVSFRRLFVLVRGIPPESAFGRSTGNYRPGWGTTEELLALLAELLDTGNRLFYGANRRRGAPAVWKPLKITRPTDETEEQPRRKRRPATSADLVEMFGGIAQYTGPARALETEDPEQLPELAGPVPDPREPGP